MGRSVPPSWPGTEAIRASLRTRRPCQRVEPKLENGLLIIDLKKEIPEEMKPRRIAIKADAGKKSASKRIEGKVAA